MNTFNWWMKSKEVTRVKCSNSITVTGSDSMFCLLPTNWFCQNKWNHCSIERIKAFQINFFKNLCNAIYNAVKLKTPLLFATNLPEQCISQSTMMNFWVIKWPTFIQGYKLLVSSIYIICRYIIKRVRDTMVY